MFRTEILTRKVPIDFGYVGKDTKANLEQILKQDLEGKCSVEGFIRPNSTNILTYSSGRVNGNQVLFEVGFECQVCSPVEGQMMTCKVTNVSKAGIRAITTLSPNPVDVFCARDHHMYNNHFLSLKEGDTISWKKASAETEYYKQLTQTIESKTVMSWLSLDTQDLVGQVLSLPNPDDIEATFDGKAIVEYYSR